MTLLFTFVISTVEYTITDHATAEFRLTTIQFICQLSTKALLLEWDLACFTWSRVTNLFTFVYAAIQITSTYLITAELGPRRNLARHKLIYLLAMAHD